ncbi:hypothetical protein [Reichenbachiella versicolor]|uniref:hypothetical protein n=1 Tax=Reichenbachiella versicolor TaxID=1821036 RepID=UPI000D6E91D0|nr:hypothetical protein [Reichenbachiella versicolor]
MNHDINASEIRELLKKVCEDPIFAKSPRYTQLLTFLTDQALEGTHVKEQTIGMSMFEKTYNPIKDDGKVRVYMFNLRKKLSKYYSEEGANDPIIFSLKKGTYDLQFEDKKTYSEETNDLAVTTDTVNSSRRYQKLTILLSLVLVVTLVSTFYDSIISQEMYCWEPFLNEDITNTFVLADQVIMSKPGTARGSLFTRIEVNSADEYIEYNLKHREDSFSLADYTLFTKGIPFSLIKLTSLFSRYNADITPQPESELKYDAVKRGNIVYIGQQKTMSLSKEIFLKNSKAFECKNEMITFTKDDRKTIYRPKHGDNIRMEYSIVSYMPLEDGHKALFFTSNHDIGVMATVDMFTDLEQLKEFYKKLPSKDSYFNALFKVEGLNRLDVSCELVELEIVE